MGSKDEVIIYGTYDGAAATWFEGIAKLIEAAPNRTFADGDVRKSGRRLANLLLFRLDGEMPNDE